MTRCEVAKLGAYEVMSEWDHGPAVEPQGGSEVGSSELVIL